MKSVVLLLFETDQQLFDRDLSRLLAAEQDRHKSMYRVDTVYVQPNDYENELNTGDLTWRVKVDSNGVPEQDSLLEMHSAQLTTKLYSNMMEHTPDSCEFVIITNGDALTGIAAMHIGEMITRKLMRSCAVNTHIMLLQDQEAFQDARVAMLFETIKRFNLQNPHYYSDIFLMPWEAQRRTSTRKTINALIKTMSMSSANSYSKSNMLYGEQWIETAAVARLSSPSRQIRRMLFTHLTTDFDKLVLEPALTPSDEMRAGARDLQNTVREIVNTISDMERKNGLPPLEELYMIMPERDPTVFLSIKDAPRPDVAWGNIQRLYSDSAYRYLQARMNPDTDSLVREYDDQQRAISVLLVQKVLEIGEKRGSGFDELPTLVDNLKQQVLTRLETLGVSRDENDNYNMAISSRKRNAINVARTRHVLLSVVYEEARRNFGSKRAELRSRMFKSAAETAKRYISDCIISLKKEFGKMCGIKSAEVMEREYYSHRLDDAYTYWCRHSAGEQVGLAELYECFSEEVCRMSYDEAAQDVCRQLEDLFEKRTDAAMDHIRVRVQDFFSELKFRSDLLEQYGHSSDMNAELLEYLNSQLETPPLMRVAISDADRQLKSSSRTFVIQRSDESADFANQVEETLNNAGILYDPYENGVQMIVRYSGNALENLIVYQNNITGRNDDQ